jgi:hypothetical protein
MSFRVSDLVTNVAPAIPLAVSCTTPGGYSGKETPPPEEPKSPPADPSQDYAPTRMALGSEALFSLRRQLRQSLWMQRN